MSGDGASGQRTEINAVRRCKRGYEFGYYAVLEDDTRCFIRVGIARTYERAVSWLEIVMSETRVVNSVKDRSKYMRLKLGTAAEPVYEYGWMTYNRRDRSQDYFNKAGEGTYEEAQLWMANFGYRRRVQKSFVHGQG